MSGSSRHSKRFVPMKITANSNDNNLKSRPRRWQSGYIFDLVSRILVTAGLTLIIFYLSLMTFSTPLNTAEMASINRAIAVLEAKEFTREVFLLRNFASFRSSDNWINSLIEKENAFAATNCPFGIITLYPDFYHKATDDTTRAMILLHEAQHLQGKDESETYEYVWQKRHQLGWTILTHGTTPTFVTVEMQTREFAPHLFSCSANLWNDCTERLQARRRAVSGER